MRLAVVLIGLIVVGAVLLIGLQPAKRKPLWRSQTGRLNELALGKDCVYVFSESNLTSIDFSGKENWSKPLPQHVSSRGSSVLTDTAGNCYVNLNSEIQAFNADGSSLWKFPTNAVRSVFAIQGETIIVIADSEVTSLSTTGQVSWQKTYPHLTIPDPIIDRRGNVYFFVATDIGPPGSPQPLWDRKMVSLDAAGKERWRGNGWPLKARGESIFVAEAGQLKCLSLQGAELWSAQLKPGLSDVVFDDQGNIFCLGYGGRYR